MNPPPSHPRSKTAFGVDENNGSPILVKATRRGRRLMFERIPLPGLSSPKPGTLIAASLFQRESFVRWLSAPIASPRKAEAVFPSLLDIQIPFPVEDCDISLVALAPTPDRTGTRGLVAGARHTDIAKRLQTLAACGIDPQILDQEGVALWSRCLDEIPPAPGATPVRIVVYVGADRVTAVLGQGREYLSAHTMRQLDPDALLRFLKSSLPVPPETTQWLWAGPMIGIEDISTSLQTALAGRWPGTHRIVNEPETFLARALAARALIPAADCCNLRTGRFLHPDLTRWNERQPYRWAIACLAAGMCLCSVNLVWQVASTRRLAQTQQGLHLLASGITGSSRGIPAGQEVLTARRALEARTRELEPFIAATEKPVQGALSVILSAAREEGVTLETLTLGLKQGVIHGMAPKLTQGEALARRLNVSGWTTTIERKDSLPGDERVAFVIGLGQPHGKK